MGSATLAAVLLAVFGGGGLLRSVRRIYLAETRARSAAEHERLFFYTLIGCLAGLLISILVWVFSSRAQNYHHATLGRQGTIIAFLGALIAGAAPALINFFQGLGSQVK